MNTNKLATLYPTLEASERLSLMLAAAARGDEAEHARLIGSAPRVTHSMPHTFPRALAFLTICGHYRMVVLDLAAMLFKTTALAEETRGKQATRCRDIARIFAYLVKVTAQGWVQFCSKERLDPKIGTTLLPGEFVEVQALEEAEVLAFTAEEVREFGRRKGTPFESLKTAESVVAELGSIYKMLVDHWE